MDTGKRGKIIFSPKDYKFIQDNWLKMTNPELAAALGLKLTRLRNELHSMGLKRMEMEYWTTEQIEYLKQSFGDVGDVELAEFFQYTWPKGKLWTCKHIRKKRVYLDLHRTPEQIASIRRRNSETGRYDNVKKRWATTGSYPIGTLRVWKKQHDEGLFVVIKTEKEYVHYNRWLWEQAHGELRSDQLVVPKDGVKLFCELTDLEIIDRSEHARRNAIRRSNMPEDYKENRKLINKLKKIIHDKNSRPTD